MVFNKIEKIYFCKGDKVPGQIIYEEKIEGSEQVLVGPYGAVIFKGKHFLIEGVEALSYIGSQFIDGEYHLLYKSGESYIWKNSKGEVVSPEDWICIGMPAITPAGEKGVVVKMSKGIATVDIDGQKTNYFKKSLKPYLPNKKSLDQYQTAFERFHKYLPAIREHIIEENTRLIKSEFDTALDKLKEHNPDIKTTEELRNPSPEPEPKPQPEPKRTFMQRLFNKKPVAPAQTTPPPTPSFKANKPVHTVPEHIGRAYRTIEGEPNTANKDVHKLTHIDLNPHSQGPNDKYIYHYEVGEHRDPIATTNYLGSNGKKTEPHSFVKNGVFIPGEQVEHNGQDYSVISHIDYDPTTKRYNMQNMLVRDKAGNVTSIPRHEAKLTSSDYTKNAAVELSDGSKKFHHQLQVGDKINDSGNEHEVIYQDPQKGYISQDLNSGKMYFHSPQDYQREYRAKDKAYTAKRGDKIKIGSNVFTLVGESSKKGKSIVSIKDQNGDRKLFEIDSDYLNDKVVKKRKMKLLNPEDYGHADVSKVPSAKDVISQTFTAPESKGLPLGETKLPEPTKEEIHNDRISLLDRKLGEHRKSKDKEGNYQHKLGIGDLAVKTTMGEDNRLQSEIVNPEVQLGAKNKSIIVKDYDPASDVVRFRMKGDKPSKKPEEMKINDFKTWIKENEKDLHDDNTIKANLQRAEDSLHSDLVKNIAKHMDLQGHDKVTAKDIQDELNDPEGYLRNKLNDKISKYEKDYHNIKSGGSAVESDDYEKMGDVDNILKDAFDDESYADDVNEAIKGIRESKAQDVEREELEGRRKKVQEAKRQAEEQNKTAEQKPEKDYVKKTYNKLGDIFSKSVSKKAGVESVDHNISVKSDKHNNTKAEFHIINAGDLHTSDNLTPEHEKRHSTGDTNLHKVPFLKNTNFPPTGAQLRDYSSDSQEADAARKFTIENVSDNFNPAEVTNTSPQGNTNAPIVDSKGVVMGGNGRVLATRLLSDDNIKKNKEEIKSKLKQFYPEASDEQIKNLEKEVDKAKNPMVVRVAKHSSGEYYDYGKHNEDYKDFTRVLNQETTKAQSQRAKSEGLASSLSTEKREDLYKMIPPGTNINKHIATPKNAHQILDKLEEHKVITPDERSILTDEKGLTDEGKRLINDVYQKGYFSKEGETVIDKLPADQKTKINDFKNAHIGALLDLKTNNPYYDLQPELEDVARSLKDDSTQLEGQKKIVEDSIPTKGIKYIMTLPAEEQKEIMDTYMSAVRNMDESIKGNSLFADAGTDKADLENLKNNFFEKYAKHNDYLQSRKKETKKSIDFARTGITIRRGFELLKSAKVIDIASVAVMGDGKILMGRRRDSDLWTLPGGHVEEGETPLQGAKRELEEETGIKATALKHLGSEEIISEIGKPIRVHAYLLEGNPPTSMKDDPDTEVKRWFYLQTPLTKDVLEALHAPRNVTLKLLKLQKWEKSIRENMFIQAFNMAKIITDDWE